MAKTNYVGISAYAGMHREFPVKKFLQQFPDDLKKPCIALLAGTFGWDRRLVEKFIAKFTYQKHLIEFHISNGASRRSGNLAKGSMAWWMNVPAFNAALESRSPDLREHITEFVHKILTRFSPYFTICTQVLLCPELEDNMTNTAFKVFLAWTKKAVNSWKTRDPDALIDVPAFKYGRSPCMGGKEIPAGVYHEKHGVTYPMHGGQVGNMDGISINFHDGEDFFQQVSTTSARNYLDKNPDCFATMLWSANQQGIGDIQNWNEKPPHKERNFIVTDQAIAGMRALLQGR